MVQFREKNMKFDELVSLAKKIGAIVHRYNIPLIINDDIDAALTNSIPKEPTQVTTSSDTVAAGMAAVAINRVAPTATAITLPAVAAQDGIPLRVVDWSTSVTEHTITITPDGSETIMRAASWDIISNSVQLASLTLYPSTTLGGWYIAP